MKRWPEHERVIWFLYDKFEDYEKVVDEIGLSGAKLCHVDENTSTMVTVDVCLKSQGFFGAVVSQIDDLFCFADRL